MPILSPSPRPRGFALIEVVGALFLLGVFFYISTRVFVDAHNLNKRALETTAGIERLDSAVRSLRRDVWDAVTFQTPSEKQLFITQNPDTHIAWTLSADGDLTRTQTTPSASDQTWTKLPPIRMSVQNRAVLLAITENNQTQTMTLPSQVSPPEVPHE